MTPPAITVLHGDCLHELANLPDNSVDSIVTDPPYGLGFMGKTWDNLPPGLPWAQECLRVLKPGGHLLAFGGTRTWHRLAVAVEDAGFEMRDSIAWLYGSGFPKSLDVSKAIDKAAGAEREVVGSKIGQPGVSTTGTNYGQGFSRAHEGRTDRPAPALDITAPATDAAAQWSGWGTALKPAFEPIVVARKPLVGTVAQNVQAHGTGALNIDATRVAPEAPPEGRPWVPMGPGRWPANVVLSDDQAAALDQQSGTLTSGANPTRRGADGDRTVLGAFSGQDDATPARGADSGGASRFFPTFRYQAKAPTRERPSYEQDGGAGNVPAAAHAEQFRCTLCGRTKSGRNTTDGPCACVEPQWEQRAAGRVAHPTVKPLDLMRWLVRLVTPPGGIVLEPFAGSGTTVEACLLEGFGCIAIEREADYLPLIEQRITRARAVLAEQEAAARAAEQEREWDLFSATD